MVSHLDPPWCDFSRRARLQSANFRMPAPRLWEAARGSNRAELRVQSVCLFVIQHVRPKYACKACEGNIVIGERLAEPIEKGLPGPGLLAQVAVSKYADHLPLYRQEGIFRRHGVELPRQTTCDWMAVIADLLEPIWKVMHRLVLQSRVVQTDDTTVTVLDPVLGRFVGRLWVYLGDRFHPYVVYHFTENHSGDGPQEMFAGYQGYLQADAYSGYDALYTSGKILEVGCWMHGTEVLRGQDQRSSTVSTKLWRGSVCFTRSKRRPRKRSWTMHSARLCARRNRGPS